MTARTAAIGADPWNVLLALAALIVLVVGVWRGRSYLRRPFAVAVGLTVGYLLFTAVARWSEFNVRYYLPLLVAWAAIIAIAAAEFPRWVARLLMIGLLVAALPQLLNNAGRPLVPPARARVSYLEPYFVEATPYSGSEGAAYQAVTGALSESTCRKAAIGNWILLEYPLWVGLQHDRWPGQLNDFDVHNQTSRLQPSYRPCAWITKQNDRYQGPDNGTVNFQEQDIAISVDAADAATIRTPVGGFSSAVRGATLLPGGGWYLPGLDDNPVLGTRGSLYVFAKHPGPARLDLALFHDVPEPDLVMVLGDGQSTDPSTSGRDLRFQFDASPRRESDRT